MLQKAPPRETQCCRCSVLCPQCTGPMAPQGHRAWVAARTGRLKRLRYNDAQNVTVTWLEQV